MNEIVVAPIQLEEAPYEPVAGDPLIRRNLSMLGHVNVRLEVLLGTAEMSVEKLFSLSKGDTVTLDTHLDAPVTLQLDGKSIARGQLMAVGDSFGLKITEIL
ncbi:FliM/FliN family flagellar motor switch protein [Dyella choica]|uniref:Flagellar motor switch protein FliN n=1 Tax=Dyella choica TaxID=1927959 RepID=A0A3S0PGU1_9GAMM|nr:FliM/FliN family flagellar motor switch protein [Dyella choica]RUL72719.1 flagellar motor switch protein FliN [Dyella choica]